MTQKAIIDRCKSILDKTSINGSVTDPDDFKFLMESFAQCPYFDMKTQGQEIIEIQKKKSGIYGTCFFYLKRSDGTCTDISYRKMFRKDPQTDDVLAALRTAIDPIISEFRQTFEPFDYEGKHIEKVEEVPETIITLTNGKKYIVLESVAEVKEQVIRYKNKIINYRL